MHCFPFLRRLKFLPWLFQTCFFFHLEDKKRWSSYTVTFIWGEARGNSALVVLDEWPYYGGGRLSRFDNILIHNYIYITICIININISKSTKKCHRSSHPLNGNISKLTKKCHRSSHPLNGNSQDQQTFLDSSADKQTHNYDTEWSNHHPHNHHELLQFSRSKLKC